MKISACIIAKNEALTIASTLASIGAVVDDIVVVDTGSQDRTKEIAQFYGARTFSIEWNGFAHARNIAMNHARYDWILNIDCDETLSPLLQTSLLKLKDQRPDENMLFTARIRVIYGGHIVNFTSWSKTQKKLLFNRKATGKWSGRIHETLQNTKNLKKKELKGFVFHWSFKGPGHHITKACFYAREEALAKHKTRSYSLPYFLLSPVWTFFKDYFLYLGFLGGKTSLNIARINAMERVLRNYLMARLLGKKYSCYILKKLLLL